MKAQKPRQDLYAELGVRRGASGDEVKRAYRRRARAAHPDKPGGAAEEFVAVQLAYDVLSDGRRRAEYDRTGEVSDPASRAEEALLRAWCDAASKCDDPAACDLLAEAKRTLERALARAEAEAEAAARAEAKYAGAAARVERADGERNALADAALSNAARAAELARLARAEAAAVSEALGLADAYRYRAERAGASGDATTIESLIKGGFTVFPRGDWQ